MDYFVNEYSLRGQFPDIDAFYESLRKYTIPVLKKISDSEENIIWKKDDFWNREICRGVTLLNIPERKNERNAEKAALKAYLRKLAQSEPYWSFEDERGLQSVIYDFDEEFRECFEVDNCFLRAIKAEGRILSFEHDSYKCGELRLILTVEGAETECILDNVYSPEFWEKEARIRHWHIENRYYVEIRANEYEFHAPHFHVSDREHGWVFLLENGTMPESTKCRIDRDVRECIENWYKEHMTELTEAWNGLHPERKVNGM